MTTGQTHLSHFTDPLGERYSVGDLVRVHLSGGWLRLGVVEEITSYDPHGYTKTAGWIGPDAPGPSPTTRWSDLFHQRVDWLMAHQDEANFYSVSRPAAVGVLLKAFATSNGNGEWWIKKPRRHRYFKTQCIFAMPSGFDPMRDLNFTPNLADRDTVEKVVDLLM